MTITTPVSFYFLRHGESNVNVSGICAGSNDCTGLSREGRQQVEDLAQALPKFRLPVTFVICSPILRTVETAQAAARATASPLLVDERLRERNYGEWEGKPFEPVKASLLAGNTPPGGEGQADLIARATAFLENPPVPLENTLVVSHGGFWQTLFDLYGRGTDAPWIGYAELYAVSLTPGGIEATPVFVEQREPENVILAG